MTIINKVSNRTLMPGITPIPDVVDAPTIGSATAVDYQSATVAFTAAATGGTATSFTAISTPGSVTGSSATSPITVSGLTDNTSYTFKVYGANSSGTWSAVQSSASGSITTPVGPSFDSIATVTVGAGGSSSISFSSIPSTYKHLQIRWIARTNRANSLDAIDLQFNSDSTQGNYVRHELDGNGTSASASAGYPQSGNYPFWITYVAGNSATASVFGAGVIDILDYANTNKYKTSRSLGGYDNNGSGYVNLFSHLYMTTTAISSIQLTSSLGTGFQQYSQFALFGVKG